MEHLTDYANFEGGVPFLLYLNCPALSIHNFLCSVLSHWVTLIVFVCQSVMDLRNDPPVA